jgi:hypothetical protein
MHAILMLAFILAGAVPPRADPGANGAKALAQLRTLVGEWRGSFQWTGARNDHGEMNATYSLTGNGSAVVENLVVDGTALMTSVYHLDASELRMTHYCAAQNQPRLKARSFDPDTGTIEFEFVDATNLASADAPHVHSLVLRNPDRDHLELQFKFTAGTRVSVERITLSRARDTKP